MFTGVVRYVGDGDSLCTGPAGRPDRWIDIRLGDFYAPELHDLGGAEGQKAPAARGDGHASGLPRGASQL